MRNRTLMIGAVAGVVAALSLSASLAAAAPTSQTLQATVSPSKLSKKTFGGVSLHAVIGTTFDNFTTPGTGPRQTVFTIDPNIKFTNGNVPTCQLSQIQGKFTAQAQAACPHSIVGSGSVQVNDGAPTAVGGTATIFGGGPNTMYVQTDIGPGATSLTIIGALGGKNLVFSNLPNTPGLLLTNFDVSFKKRNVGKKKGVAQFYVSARCKKGKWANSEFTSFYSGQTLSASSTQKCKGKK